MKDTTLTIEQRIARLEKAVFGQEKGKTTTRPAAGKNFEGPSGGVRFLVSQGFFRTKRGLADVRAALTKNDLLTKLHQARTLMDECIAGLEGQPHRKPKGVAARPAPSHKPALTELDFDAHERAFIKAHARKLSGPKKFVLLLAYMTKGQTGKEVQVKDIEKHWNKMTSKSLMDGEFNGFYPNRAKEQGWVNTKKQGVYVLRPSWTQVLKS